MSRLPLENFRVIDLTMVWAGPFATQLLADMGAEVIMIEPFRLRLSHYRGGWLPKDMAVPEPVLWNYPDRDPGERPYNRSALFNKLNRNKYGMTLDLDRAEGKEIFKNLVRIADVVTENYSPRVMANFGLDYPILREIKPDVIMLSMPGFGRTGPERDNVSYGTIIEPMSGISELTGYPDGPPLGGTLSYGDATAGLHGAFAVLAALEYRRRTGKGQHIDLSQLEALVPLLGEAVMDYTMNSRVQTRTGNRDPSAAPHGVYRCKGDDMWVAIAVGSDDQWERFCKALSNPPWSQDQRFQDCLGRWEHQDELDALIEQWTREREPMEVMKLLQDAHIAAGPVLSAEDLYKDPHLNERGFFEEVRHPEAGTHRYRGMPFRLSGCRCGIRMPAPCLGEHNEYVLGELLGLSGAEIMRLTDEKIIGTAPLLE